MPVLVCHTRFGHRLGNEPELGSSSFIRPKTIVASQSPISVPFRLQGQREGREKISSKGCDWDVLVHICPSPRKYVRSDGKQCRLRLSSNQPEGDCQVTTSDWIHIP